MTFSEKTRITKLAKLKIEQYVGQRRLQQSVQILLGAQPSKLSKSARELKDSPGMTPNGILKQPRQDVVET